MPNDHDWPPEAFRDLVATTPDCVALLGPDGIIRQPSPTVGQALGYRPEELIGTSVFDLINPRDVAAARRVLERGAVIPGFAAALEFRVRHKDRSWRRFAVLGINSAGAAATIGLVLLCRDITATRRAEEGARALMEVQRHLVETLDPEKIPDRVVSSLLWLFRVRRAILYHADPGSGGLVCVATAGATHPTAWIGEKLPPGAGAGGRAVAEGRTLQSPDLTGDPSFALPGWLRARLSEEGCAAAAAAPLLAHGEMLGAIVLHDVPGRQFAGDEMGLLSALADQAALASHNATLHRQAEKRAERLATLHALVRSLNLTMETRELLRAVARAAVETVGARAAAVFLPDREARGLRVRATSGIDAEIEREAPRPVVVEYGQGLTGRVFESRRPEYVEDLQADTRGVLRSFAARVGFRAYAGLPLVVQGAAVGVLTVVFAEGRRLDREDKEALELLADHAAIALRRAQAEEETRRRQQAAEALVEVGRIVSLSLDPETVARRIVESLIVLLGATHAAVRRIDPETGEAVALAYSGRTGLPAEHPARLPAGVGLVGLAVMERRPVVTADALSDPRVTLTPELRRWTERAGYRSVLAVPLVVEDRVIGVLSASRPGDSPLGDEDLALAQAFAYQAEIALGNSERYVELRTAFDRREESEERFRGLMEGIDALVWEADATGRLTFISRGADGIAGPDVEQASTLRELWERLAHPEDRQRVLAFLEIAAAEGTNGVTEHRVLGADGQVYHVLHRVRVAKDAEGRVRQLRGLVVDVTGEEKAEQRQRLQATVTRILAEAPTLRGAIQELLRAICELLGWDLGEMWLLDGEAGLMRWEDMWSATAVDGDAFGQASAGMAFPMGMGLPGRTWARNEPLWVPDVVADQEFVRARLAAAQGFHAAFSFPIRASGEVTGVMLFLGRDVRPADPLLLEVVADLGQHIGQFAERKRVEQALARSQEMLRQAQRLEGLGRLAGGVAHDFNNLLTVIIGRSALLQSALEESSPLRRYADIVHQTAERAAALTRQLLAFSRQQKLQPRVLDLAQLLSGLEEMLRRLIREDIELAVPRPSGLWRVRADPTQLEQVIVNLAVNARDAMPEGGRLTIRAANVELNGAVAAPHPGARPGAFVLLEVADTGVGMPPDVQARIFEPFFTTKEMGRGTGLGLATVYGIVRQHEGWIEVRSQPGRGTTFAVYLPRVEDPAEADEARPAHREGLTGSETILLAEDEDEVRSVVCEMLESLGYRVIVAGGPAEALERVQRLQEPIHLLLTDVVMPGMRGPELARRATELRPALKVLYISGHADDTVFRDAVIPRGMVILEKPFTPESLAVKVREVLDR